LKKIGSVQIAFAFAGCFLGAGYVSGQEMWQFFGRFGSDGLFGLLLALILLAATGIVTLLLVKKTGETQTDRLILGNGPRILRWMIFALETVFLLGVAVIMTAGVGALGCQLLHIPTWIGCLFFIILISVIALAGIRGVVNAFSATVPVLVVVTLVFGLFFGLKGNSVFSEHPDTSGNGTLLLFWPLAAATFACYNVFGSIAILSPLGPALKSRKSIVTGILLGSVILFIVALSTLVSVNAAHVQGEELPMLAAALEISYPVGLVYGFLLFLAMLGTGLSCFVAFLRSLKEKWELAAEHPYAVHIICSVIVFFGGLLGFGDLISVIYPLVGYGSFLFIILLFIRFLKKRADL